MSGSNQSSVFGIARCRQESISTARKFEDQSPRNARKRSCMSGVSRYLAASGSSAVTLKAFSNSGLSSRTRFLESPCIFLPIQPKFASFIVLGAALILLGLFYNKFADVIKTLLDDEKRKEP